MNTIQRIIGFLNLGVLLLALCMLYFVGSIVAILGSTVGIIVIAAILLIVVLQGVWNAIRFIRNKTYGDLSLLDKVLVWVCLLNGLFVLVGLFLMF